MRGDILHTIGGTPVVQLRKVTPADAADVYLKLEFFNPTGSYKDRMALAMIEGAEQRGALAGAPAHLWPWYAPSKATRSPP
jgi:cysteine synthase A